MNGVFRRSEKQPMNDPQPTTDVPLPGIDTPSTYWIDVTYLVESALEASRMSETSTQSRPSEAQVLLSSVAEHSPRFERTNP
ncbi:hypothetical protein [Leifsonia sp. NPDC058248]|uniref:hypothetical protein n=1 Tax=Leifsonia sp. NPDC058248 TaxID=3346402 RepID=UPI0036DB884B